MQKFCRKCDQLLRDGDIVHVVVTAEYREIPSKINFAISSHIFDADGSTLEHKDCQEGERE